MEVSAHVETWDLASPFRISGNVFYRCEMLIVKIRDGTHIGRGEATGVGYLGESATSILSDVNEFSRSAPRTFDRKLISQSLPPGGARNALDCALWELEAKRLGQSVSEIAGLGKPNPLLTNLTLGADEPRAMQAKALEYKGAPLLKLKLTGDVERDAARIFAVGGACPKATLSVDANCGYDLSRFNKLVPTLEEFGIRNVEQPFPVNQEPDLKELPDGFFFIADESVQTLSQLEQAACHFHGVNIKLDKTGGLTHALELAAAAKSMGMVTMVGNMVGTSWSQAAGFVVGQVCDVVDLDGVTFLKKDRDPGGQLIDGTVWFDDDVWGSKSKN